MSNYARLVIGKKRSVIAIAVSLGILVVLGLKVDIRFDLIMNQFRHVHWHFLLAAFGFSAFWHIFVGAHKWWRILRAMGADVPYWEVWRVRLGSDPIRFASPFKVGEVVNAIYFSRLEKFGFSRSAGSIAFDKALNFFGTLIWLYIGLTALSTQMVTMSNQILLHSAVGVAIIITLAVQPARELARRIAHKIHPKVGRLAAGILAAFEEFSFIQKIGFLLYGIIFQLRPIIVCYLLFLAFTPTQMPPIAEFLAFGSVAVLMSNVPLTVAGMGPREAAIMALFSQYAPQAMLLSIGVLMSISIHVVPAILGIPLMVSLLKSIAAMAAEKAAAAEAAKYQQPPPAGPAALDAGTLENAPLTIPKPAIGGAKE